MKPAPRPGRIWEKLRLLLGRTLRRRLVLGMVAINVVVMILFGLEVYSRQSGYIEQQRIARTTSIAQMLAQNSVLWVLSEDVAGLSELVQSMTVFPDLRYAMIVTPAGKVIAHTDPTKVGLYLADPVGRGLLSAAPTVHQLAASESAYDVAAPVVANGQLVGWAWVRVSRTDVAIALARLVRHSIFFTLSSILISAVFALIIAHGLTQSLRELAGVATRFRNGDRSVRAELGARRVDEMGDVGRGINAMLDAVESSDRELKARESELVDAQRIARLGKWRWNIADGTVTWSDETFRILGLAGDEVTPTRDLIENAIHPEDRARVDALLVGCLNDPASPRYSVEHRIVRSDGEILFVHSHGEVSFNEAGKPLRLVATIQDVSERAKAQADLVNSETRTRLIMEAVPVGLITTDGAGIVETFNAAAESIFGYRRDEIEGRKIFDLYAEPYRERFEALLSTFTPGRTGEFINAGPRAAVAVKKDGTRIPVELVASEVTIGGVRKFIAALQDISDKQAAEEKLRQSQKMETIGQLTGGVAHDFNNVLMALQMNLEMVRDSVADGEEAGAFMAGALKAVGRGAELTGRLLAFSRKQALSPKVVNVNALVVETMRLLHRTLEASIQVETVLGAGIWPIEIDPNQFANALINLALNARDAMPGGGKLTIETANTRLDDDYARQHDEVRAGQHVMIAVSDAGTGMTKEVMERAFDPFFTTKEVGKGTGLGLSMVYGFVKQSGGHVKLYSEVGHGTTIKMYFPRSAAPQGLEVRRDERPTAEARGETILLVEDDQEVRDAIIPILTGLGYVVHAASDGLKALGLIDGGLRPDALLVDVVLPEGMSGRDVARAVTERVPACKMLFMSGYTDNAIVHHGRLDPDVVLLSKPFSREALAAKLRAQLDGTA